MNILFVNKRLDRIIVSTVTLLLAISCSENKEVDEILSSDVPISFSLTQNTWNEISSLTPNSDRYSQTRAEAVTNENLSRLYESFKVMSFPVGTVSNLYFEDYTYQQSETWKTYENHYWPLNASLDFYAYAPREINPSVSKKESSELSDITFSYTVPKDPDGPNDATKQKDLIFAITREHGKTIGPVAGAVPLMFKHALSSIVFQTGDSFKGKIKSISLTNLYDAGICAYDGNSFTWSYGDNTRNETFIQNFDVPTFVDGKENHEVTFYNDNRGEKTFMLLPQQLGDNSMIQVEFELDNVAKDVFVLKAPLKTNTPNGIWQSGKTYCYRLNISLYEITITAHVTDWFVGNRTHISF